MGGQRSYALAKQEQTGLLRAGFGPTVARWPHIGTSWSKSKKGEVSRASRGVFGKEHSPASVSPPSFPALLGRSLVPSPACYQRYGPSFSRTSSRCRQGLGETETTQAKPVKKVLQSSHAQSFRKRSFMGYSPGFAHPNIVQRNINHSPPSTKPTACPRPHPQHLQQD